MSPPIRNQNPNTKFHPKSTALLPDLFFTAFSLIFLFSSSSKPHSFFKIPPPPLTPFPQTPRRLFLRNPTTTTITMSQSNPNPNTNLFSSPQTLSDWLKPRLPSDSFSAWGVKPGTKNVHNLWIELSEGETSLLDSTPPVRTVNVVTVRINNGGDGTTTTTTRRRRTLVESHQELSDGTIRERFRPLSEKMKPDESVEQAVVRAVKEELGSILIGGSLVGTDFDDIVKIVKDSYRKKVEERVSVSYPGLPARYVLHCVDACVDGLPEGEFCTTEEEYSESEVAAEKAVSVKKHFWKWVDSDSV